MDLYFARNDLLQTATTQRGTLVVLPLSTGKKQQKVGVGDSDGILQVFAAKQSGETIPTFKTAPTGSQINCVSLGLGESQEARLFTSHGTSIRGVTKKGKEFFRFDTNLTEEIRLVRVKDVNIFTAGEFSFCRFVESKDVGFMMAPDRINDILVAPVTSTSSPGAPNCVLGCKDRKLRVLEGSNTHYEAPAGGSVSCTAELRSGAASAAEPGAPRLPGEPLELVFGTENGMVGQAFLWEDKATFGWTIPNTKKGAAIRAVKTEIDFSRDGQKDVCVGRDDGTIEVYSIDRGSDPRLTYKRNLTESITSLDGGAVTRPEQPDLVVATYSGKVIALMNGRPDELQDQEADAERARVLREEIAELRLQVERAAPRAAAAAGAGAQPPAFIVQDRFALRADDGTWELTIEAPTPIFAVVLSADVSVDLLEVQAAAAILSQCKPDPENGRATLATYRCQDSVSRLVIPMRCPEGQPGTLRAFVLPKISPKTSVEVQHRLRPLCLHAPASAPQAAGGDPPPLRNTLRVKGDLSVEEMHGYVVGCLPDVTARVAGEGMELHFEHCILGTRLMAQYRAGEAVFSSDNITCLSVLKDYITREATMRKKRITAAIDLTTSGVRHFCGLIYPLLQAQLEAERKAALIEALQEVGTAEGNDAFLSAKYKQVLADAQALLAERGAHPKRREALVGFLRDFFVDWHRHLGANVKPKLGAMDGLLRDREVTLEALCAFVETGGEAQGTGEMRGNPLYAGAGAVGI